MTTGQIIRTARKERGLTQKQLAEKCGMATGTIQQYELNKREPRQKQLQKIANALDVNIDYLITGKSSKQFLKEMMKEFSIEAIGDNICKHRKEQGLTQKELADFTELSESTIKEYEENKGLPPIEDIKTIASFLGVNISDIVEDLSLYPGLEKDMTENPFSYANDYCNFLQACDRRAKTKEKKLLEDYRKLNLLGQDEARKRLNELTEIKKYTEEDLEEDSISEAIVRQYFGLGLSEN